MIPDPAPAPGPAADADPRPEPPPAPDIDACCGNGCDPCIFDLHDLAMDAWRQSLRAWRLRHPDAPDVDPGTSRTSI